jgi:hypothetical protein
MSPADRTVVAGFLTHMTQALAVDDREDPDASQ